MTHDFGTYSQYSYPIFIGLEAASDVIPSVAVGEIGRAAHVKLDDSR